MTRSAAKERLDVCKRVNAPFLDSEQSHKLGISLNVREGVMPLNGLRLKPSGDLSGWYIWAGTDMHPEDDHFYKPLHVSHIDDWNPLISKYLGLAPGWRFLVDAEGYEDVWFDQNLMEIET